MEVYSEDGPESTPFDWLADVANACYEASIYCGYDDELSRNLERAGEFILRQHQIAVHGWRAGGGP